jgi:hypothetical protein
MVAAVWWWLATPVALTRAPIDGAAKLECVSYAPFRGEQTPHDPTLIVSPAQIARISASSPRSPNASAPIPSTTGSTRCPSLHPGLD